MSVAVSVERGAARSRDSAYFPGGRDCENASTKCTEDFVGRSWRLWTTYAIRRVMRERWDWAIAVDMILCLIEKAGIEWSDSGEDSGNAKQFGGRIELSS